MSCISVEMIVAVGCSLLQSVAVCCSVIRMSCISVEMIVAVGCSLLQSVAVLSECLVSLLT